MGRSARAAVTEGGSAHPPRGEELTAGTEALPAGRVLDPADLALAAACGAASLRVYRRPHVAVLSTGSELVPLGAEPGPGQIVETNS